MEKNIELKLVDSSKNFKKALCPIDNEITLHNMYVPFGVNKNMTIKFQFNKQNEIKAKYINNIDLTHYQQLIEKHTISKESNFIYKVQKNKSYLSTILCTVPQIKKQIQTKISSRELNTIFTLKHKKVDITIKNPFIWINTSKNIISSCWIVTHIKVS
jgi:hypothetical protein